MTSEAAPRTSSMDRVNKRRRAGAGAFDGLSVLVVGGAGFVGGNLVRTLLASSPRVGITVVDNLLSSERSTIPADPRIAFIRGSIADNRVLARIRDEHHYIFHLATYHGNQSSIHDPLADHRNNLLTTLKLMNHARDFRTLRRLVYASAGCGAAVKTFGRARATAENAPLSLEQDSPYAISKVVGEYYAVYFHRQHGLPTVRARFQNVYGPGEILGAGRWRGTPATVWRNVVPVFVYRALTGEPLPVENRGAATRDFIYVDDVCRGLIACALKGAPGGVYNLASGQQTSILHLARMINRLAANPAGVTYLPRRPWDHSGKRFGSIAKARREIGFEARTGLDEGLGLTIAWTGRNLRFIASRIKKHARHLATASS
jgi:UDP-glucose 4-epimerase